jgi:hypothetical protein
MLLSSHDHIEWRNSNKQIFIFALRDWMIVINAKLVKFFINMVRSSNKLRFGRWWWCLALNQNTELDYYNLSSWKEYIITTVSLATLSWLICDQSYSLMLHDKQTNSKCKYVVNCLDLWMVLTVDRTHDLTH